MAVANTFTFGSISSSTYGVVVEGSGDYSAPKRDVEMIEIPGRNGSFALDRGRFENITVEYDCVIQNTTQATFEASVASFRNAIVSQKGYQRLTDTYHPNEYRMAVYAGGFDEAPAFHGKGAVFKVKFNCKPQRFLTSGETATTVANNGTMTNPTLFDSSPLLAVKGYGNIGFNGYNIKIQNVTIGNISIINDSSDRYTYNQPYTFSLETGKLNSGDAAIARITMRNQPTVTISGDNSTGTRSGSSAPTDTNSNFSSSYSAPLVNTEGVLYFNIGTNASATNTTTGTANYWSRTKGDFVVSYSITQTIQYVASTNKLTVTCSGSASTTTAGVTASVTFTRLSSISITATSTVSAVTSEFYIDCDIGEVYTTSNNEVVPLNDIAIIGSELPKLAPGTNTFTKDNTITQLKVTPRWWKV